ncbi:MAG: flavodoxin [Selenomonadaceae bacterium]|nr:flavodoxin [Selenomonadaceae bacterium]
MTALMSLTLAACGAGDSKTTAKQGKDGENSSKSKILVAYFSRADENYGVGVIEKGNTRILAEMIAEKTGADLFEIKPVKAYPKEYTPATQVAKVEKEQNARPEIEGPLPDMSKYDTVFIGYPIWWSDLPMPVYTFIDKENFVGKTVIPFCTHEGSGIGSTERFIADTTKAKTLEGLEMRGTTAQNSPEEAKAEVLKWLKKLGY